MSSPIENEAGAALPPLLAKLHEALPAGVRVTLRPPASAADLARLTEALPEVPIDLLALLSWHDGQEWNSPLSKKNNRRLLSSSEILGEYSFFADPMSDFQEPWSASWLPVLTNDAGDFIVYETQGALQGHLLHYWHDQESRSMAYDSLLQWAEELLLEYRESDA